MLKHESKYCPRCRCLFECKAGSILLCQCSSVRLSQEERDYISEQFDGCLCAGCLKALQSEYFNLLHQNKLKRILGIFYKSKP